MVNKGERAKFRAELKDPAAGTAGSKRKREAGDEDGSDDDQGQEAAEPEKKKKKRSGPKGPNPLSVKKAKKKVDPQQVGKGEQDEDVKPVVKEAEGESSEQPAKKKRKRKQKRTDDVLAEGDAEQHAGSDGE